jgi:hypothetical protein
MEGLLREAADDKQIQPKRKAIWSAASKDRGQPSTFPHHYPRCQTDDHRISCLLGFDLVFV